MLTNDFPSFNLFALSLVFNSVNLSKNKVFHLPWKILLRITKLQKNSDNSTVWTVKSCTLNSIYAFNFFRIQASGPCSSLIIITLSMTSPCWWEKNNTTFKLIIMKQIHWILLLLRKYSFNILVTTISQNMLEKNNNKQTNKRDLLRNLVNSQSISSYRTAEKCLFFCTDWLPFFGILTETKVLFFTCGIYSVCWWKKRIFTFTLVNNLSLAKLWANTLIMLKTCLRLLQKILNMSSPLFTLKLTLSTLTWSMYKWVLLWIVIRV